jgi:flagellar motor switch protein FliN
MASAAPSQFIEALVRELAAAIEAVGGAPVPVSPGAGLSDAGWNVSLSVTGSLRGIVRLSLGAEGVTSVLQVVLGPDADTSDGAAADLLRELTGQAIGSLCLKEPFAKASVAIGSVERGTTASDQTTVFALGIGDHVLEIAGGSTLEAMVPVSSPAPAAPAVAPPKPAARAGGVTGVPTANLDVVLDIELPLSIRFGSTAMSIRSLSTLGPGSIVDMGRSPDDPVEVLVCGRVIARAEVVIVGGNYGIRITDLTSAADRIRAMEGTW